MSPSCEGGEQYLYSVGAFGCVNVLFDVSMCSNAKKCFWAGCVDCNVCNVEIYWGVCPQVFVFKASITCPLLKNKEEEMVLVHSILGSLGS